MPYKLKIANPDTFFCQDKNDILMVNRIDWRFLLPSPELNNVLYIGKHGTQLQKILTKYTKSLTSLYPYFTDFSSITSSGNYDLLVIVSSQLSTVEKVLPLLKRNGIVYWEINRYFKRFIRPRNARNYLTDFANLNLVEIDLYWHRPSFERCREIIQLKSPALQNAFSKSHSNFKKKTKIAIGRILLHTGLLFYLLPCFSLVAKKP